MKKCLNCGFENNETSNFCENCGTKFEEIAASNSESKQEEEKTSNEDIKTQSVAVENSNEVINQTEVVTNQNTNTNVNNNTVVKEDKNTIGLIGFIVSLVSLVLCCGSLSPIALVLSIVGLSESKKVNGKNKGLSIAGIIIGAVGIVLLIIFSIIGTITDAISTISS